MLENQKEITIRDLAVRLALSVATVSRALNHDSSVRPGTKKRVLDMAEELGYRTNDHARFLRNGRSHTIGCIVPRLEDPTMSTVVSGIEKSARLMEYSLMVMQSQGCKETEGHCADILLGKRVDGLVLCSPDGQNDICRLRPYVQKNIPVVLLENAESEQAFVNIVTDNRRAGYEMTRHLLTLGRKRIMHITSEGSFKGHTERCEGYRQALAEAGLPVKEGNIIRCGLSRQDGMRAAQALWQWKEKPDAIFAANDPCAVGCIQDLKKRGVRIPAEIAIAGFGNDPVSLASDPELTTVGYPGQQMGEAAVNQLMDRMQGSNSGKLVGTIVLRGNLLIRRSTVMD